MPSCCRLRLITASGLAAVLVVLGACGPSSPVPSGSPSPAPSGSLSFTQVDSGRTVTINIGQRFQVALAGNGTTGFQWTAVIGDPFVLKQAGDPAFQSSNTSPGIAGAGGIYAFLFEALHAGSTPLAFNYARSFESGARPVQVVTFVVVVG